MKLFFSLLAIAITFWAFWHYIQSIRSGKIQPHPFSWAIWGSATIIVGLASWADGAGIGSWPIIISGLITLFIAYLAWQRRQAIIITTADKHAFAMACLALPAWFFMQDPLYAVIILTCVDMLGFLPTSRKSWHRPESESLTFALLMGTRNILVLLALENYTLTTMLFPAVVTLLCVILSAVLIVRPTTKKPKHKPKQKQHYD
jgi:uncharacterized membrane protein